MSLHYLHAKTNFPDRPWISTDLMERRAITPLTTLSLGVVTRQKLLCSRYNGFSSWYAEVKQQSKEPLLTLIWQEAKEKLTSCMEKPLPLSCLSLYWKSFKRLCLSDDSKDSSNMTQNIVFLRIDKIKPLQFLIFYLLLLLIFLCLFSLTLIFTNSYFH